MGARLSIAVTFVLAAGSALAQPPRSEPADSPPAPAPAEGASQDGSVSDGTVADGTADDTADDTRTVADGVAESALDGEGAPETAEAAPTDAVPEDGAAEGLSAAQDADVLEVIVVDAAPYGVSPIVGRAVTTQMRETAEALGYRTTSAEDTVASAQRLRMPYPPAPADLWRVTFVAEAQRGAFARVWAHEGQYVFEISVASLDGAGPFFARGTSGADDLREVVDRLTREALPEPSTFDGDRAAALSAQAAEPTQAPTPGLGPAPLARPTPIVVRRRPRRSLRPTRRFDLVLQTEGAIGTTSDGFYNHLVGIRLGLRITNAIHLGLYGAYTNLNGRGGRTSNFLTMLLIEDRIRLSSRSDITVPVRLGIGYLPFNGPVIRLSAGVNLPLSPRVELGVDVLTPTFWFLPERTVVSLNFAAEVIFRLGAASASESSGDAQPADDAQPANDAQPDEDDSPTRRRSNPEDDAFAGEFDSAFDD